MVLVIHVHRPLVTDEAAIRNVNVAAARWNCVYSVIMLQQKWHECPAQEI
jgi:hypothetical protein